jgi:hypothetical protein
MTDQPQPFRVLSLDEGGMRGTLLRRTPLKIRRKRFLSKAKAARFLQKTSATPIWQNNRHAEHAAGGRAINQKTFNLSSPGGGGRAQLKQALAYDNKLISHFLRLRRSQLYSSWRRS